MTKITHLLSLFLLLLTAVILIGLQIKPFGWIIFGAGLLFLLFFTTAKFRKDILLIYISLGFLGLTPISTDTGTAHFALMSVGLFLAVATPQFISYFVYKEKPPINFKFNIHKLRNKKELLYFGALCVIVYLTFPFMLFESGSYQSWTIKPDLTYLLIFFTGLNLVGIWDEFFFIGTVFTILQRYFSFRVANLAQAIIFTAFLYTLAFRGWSFWAILLFAYLEGKVYRRTQSLFYLALIHITVDLFLFLAIIYTYYPSLMPIFFIK